MKKERFFGLREKKPPKGVIFSNYMFTFAMSCAILLVLNCSTKIRKKQTWQNPKQLLLI